MQHVGLRLHSRFLVDCENNFNKCMAIILLKLIPLTIGKIGHILISISLLFLGIIYVCENVICHQMQLFCDEGYYRYLWRGVIPILNKKLITWSNIFFAKSILIISKYWQFSLSRMRMLLGRRVGIFLGAIFYLL